MNQKIMHVLLTCIDPHEDEARNFGREILCEAEGIPTPALTPEEIRQEKETREVIEDILATLSPREEKALRMKFILSMKYAEKAREIGLQDARSARALTHRALQKLRRTIPARPLLNCLSQIN